MTNPLTILFRRAGQTQAQQALIREFAKYPKTKFVLRTSPTRNSWLYEMWKVRNEQIKKNPLFIKK